MHDPIRASSAATAMAGMWNRGVSLVIVLLMALTIEAEETTTTGPSGCTFPRFMYEAPGWDTGIRNEGRSSGSFIIFEDDRMVSIDYQNFDDPELQSLCVANVNKDKNIVSFPTVGDDGNNTVSYKCIQFVQRSTHVVQILESKTESVQSNALCEDSRLLLNPWPLVWAGIPDTYESCGISGGYNIMDIYTPVRDQHYCEGLALPPRMESECQHGEGILLNFRYPQCVSDVHLPILEAKFLCLGSWSHGDHTFTVITDGKSFLPGLWLMRFPVNITGDFYLDFVKDIVADSAVNITQTTEFLRWRLVRKVYASLCEDESSDCSNCDEDDGFHCQKSCEDCDPVVAQQRCSFDRLLRGEWIESSWSGSRTTRITSSLLYPAGLSPFECFAIGGPDSLDWLQITGRQTLVSLHKNGCRPRYACVAFNNINPVVIQYRLSQSIVWPHSQSLEAEDICDYNQFQDDRRPLENKHRSQYEKYLVKRTSSLNNQRLESCDLEHNFVFSVVLNNQNRDTCVGTLKQCPQDNHTLVLHTPACHPKWKAVQTLNCLSSTAEMRERFVILQDPENATNIFCIAGSIEPHKNQKFFLHASDCHVNVLTMIEYGEFDHFIAKFESVEAYNSSADCKKSDIAPPDVTTPRTPTTTDGAQQTETFTKEDEQSSASTQPQFSSGFDVTTPEKLYESTTVIPEDVTMTTTSRADWKPTTTAPKVIEAISGGHTIASLDICGLLIVVSVLLF